MSKIFKNKSFLILRNNKNYLLLPICIFLTSLTLEGYAHNFNITSLYDLLETHPEIEYRQIHDVESFEYEPFAMAKFPELQPNKGLFAPTFIATIPHGQVCSFHGWIKVGNNIIKEFVPNSHSLAFNLSFLEKQPFTNVKKIKGRVAVITSKLDIYYSHWLYNILGRLALLDLAHMEYDWLYVACDKPYMKETLALWGINPNKILDPLGENVFIEADELIVPSQIGVRIPEAYQYCLNWIPLELYCPKWGLSPKTTIGGNTKFPEDVVPENVSMDNYFLSQAPLCSIYFCPWMLEYLRKTFLPCLKNKTFSNLCEKIFISRNDTKTRSMFNEDEIFSLFEKQGFKRYNLAKLPLLEQLALFDQAKMIVAAHGTGLMNLIFCKPGTQVIEIFQARSDCSLYYLSQLLGLRHHCIQTMDFHDIEGNLSTTVPVFIIKNFIKNNEALFNL